MTKKARRSRFNIQALLLQQARAGEWSAIARILKSAVARIAEKQPLTSSARAFLANALEGLDRLPDGEVLVDAAGTIRRGETLPEDVAQVLHGFLTHVLRAMEEASLELAEYIAKSHHTSTPHSAPAAGIPNSSNPASNRRRNSPLKKRKTDVSLLSPNPPAYRLLKLDQETIEAFGLRTNDSAGGRPRHSEPSDQIFDEYDSLRGYGANGSQAQAILAERLDVTPRTIQRTLEKRPRASLENREGELVLKLHEPGDRPSAPLGDDPVPFEPYFKARLATAVQALLQKGISREEAFDQVAHQFGLVTEGELFGAKIVKNAVALCTKNKAGWARTPLLVCQHETRRRLPIWPTTKDIIATKKLAAKRGESPAIIDSVSRFFGKDIPTSKAIDATALELGLDFATVMSACRERFEPEQQAEPQTSRP